MKSLWLALSFALLGLAPAQAQTQCLVPAAAPATPVVSASVEGSHVLKAAPGCLLAVYGTIDSTTVGWLMTFNSTTVPADGAVTPIECVYVNTAPGSIGLNFAPLPPEWYSVGIVVVFSSTGCFTKTVSNHGFFHGLVQ